MIVETELHKLQPQEKNLKEHIQVTVHLVLPSLLSQPVSIVIALLQPGSNSKPFTTKKVFHYLAEPEAQAVCHCWCQYYAFIIHQNSSSFMGAKFEAVSVG